MIDTAIPTLNEDSLVNFEKKRKEFEVLAQIRLLQSAATLYKIQPIQTFFEWFHSIRVYDENERSVGRDYYFHNFFCSAQ